MLFWKRPAEAARLTLGRHDFQVPAIADAWWVVDGQQRLTALANGLIAPGEDELAEIYFDPGTREFVVPQPGVGRDEAWIPLHVLGDLRRLGRWYRLHQPSEQAFAVAEEAQQRLLDYEVPIYVVDTPSATVLRAIFTRLNSTGVRMRADEVFHALLGGPEAAAGHYDFSRLQRLCDIDGFGAPARAPTSAPRSRRCAPSCATSKRGRSPPRWIGCWPA